MALYLYILFFVIQLNVILNIEQKSISQLNIIVRKTIYDYKAIQLFIYEL